MGLGDWWDNWLSDPLGNTASGIESLLSTGSTSNRLIDVLEVKINVMLQIYNVQKILMLLLLLCNKLKQMLHCNELV